MFLSLHVWIELLESYGEFGRGKIMQALARSEVRKNFDFFQSVVGEWMPKHAGKFALLHNGGLVDFFDQPGDAVCIAQSRFEVGNFSIQRVTDRPVDLGFLSYASGDRTAS